MSRTFLCAALTTLLVSSGLSAQTRTTTLEAVSGIPDVDKTTQTEDVKFKSDMSASPTRKRSRRGKKWSLPWARLQFCG